MSNAMKSRELTPEAAAFRKVVGRCAAGVVLLDASGPGESVSMAVNSFAPVSVEPPLALFCAWKTSESWAGIRRAGGFSASMLTSEQIELSSAFARKRPDRYDLAEWSALPSGRRRLTECLAWMDCEIQEVMDAGDHEICLSRVVDHGLSEQGTPVVFYAGKYWTDLSVAERTTTERDSTIADREASAAHA
ncbi:flavin reductase family protein [Citricoccus sp. GCM10030269]|uniref:flavin reductase family protein n=1 Tax=Citricoccus sp. GCM10030269 TaxID=3273388 RepID=UPI00362140DF